MTETPTGISDAPDVESGAPPRQLIPSPRWVRVRLGDTFIADSKRVLLRRGGGRPPVYYFPRKDVRMDLLQPSTGGRRNGHATYWTVTTGDRVAENGAWSYPEPEGALAALRGYVAFEWDKMDGWFEEDEQVFIHPHDPYHRIDLLRSSRRVRIVIEGRTVAESDRPFLLFETDLPTRYYFRPDDVALHLLRPSERKSGCAYKGIASYWSFMLEARADGGGSKEVANIAWSYLDPTPRFTELQGLFAFFNERTDIFVDGERQARPRTQWMSSDVGG